MNVINPARCSEVVGQVPLCSEADVEKAIDSAQAAFKAWSVTTAEERASRLCDAARSLRAALPDLTTLFVRENGKPVREAERDIQRSIELMEIVAADLPEWSKPALIEKKTARLGPKAAKRCDGCNIAVEFTGTAQLQTIGSGARYGQHGCRQACLVLSAHRHGMRPNDEAAFPARCAERRHRPWIRRW